MSGPGPRYRPDRPDRPELPDPRGSVAELTLALLPSPAREAWFLGPLAVHGYALCVALGVLAGLWLTDRRYRAAGGRPDLVPDLAVYAVPVALAGARLQRIALDPQLRAAVGRDWVDFARIWDGGLGLPGAMLAAVPVVWIWSRRRRVAPGPLLAAAAPALAFGQAVAVWGELFTQTWYGRPSSVPWAVQISPLHRSSGYQAFSAFQPLFLYESAWDVIAGLALILVVRHFGLPGDRAVALGAGLVAVGWFGTGLFFGAPPRLGGSWSELAAAFGVATAATAYLLVTGDERGRELLAGLLGRLERLTGPGPTRGSSSAVIRR